MKTKSVVILIVILIISAILGVYKFNKGYQKEQENIPTMYAYDEKGNIIADYKPVDLKIDFDDRQKVIDSIKLFIDFFHIKPEELKNKDED